MILRLCVLSCFVAALISTTVAQSTDECIATELYLRSLRFPGGGYVVAHPKGRDESVPSLRATSGVVRALPKFRGKPRSTDADSIFVDRCFQSSTGGFADRPGGVPDVFATCVGLMAAIELKMPLDKYREPALRFLDERCKTVEDVRITAAALEALDAKSTRAPEWLKLIYDRRNSDGTYGKNGEIPRETANAVMTVLRLGGEVPNRETVIRVLKEGQCKDGGYGESKTGAGDLESCYRAMRCLIMLKTYPNDLEALKKFVCSCRQQNGGYSLKPGDEPSASGTYYAGYVLNWLDGKQ